MDEVYERPREKLARRGAPALTLVELLQIIIGSGSARASSARIARSISTLNQGNVHTLTFSDLLQVQGVGTATACKVLAAFEVGARVKRAPMAFDTSSVQTSARPLIAMNIHSEGSDGATLFTIHYNEARPPGIIARELITEALKHHGSRIEIAFGAKNFHKHPSQYDGALKRSLQALSRLADLQLTTVVMVHGSASTPLFHDRSAYG